MPNLSNSIVAGLSILLLAYCSTRQQTSSPAHSTHVSTPSTICTSSVSTDCLYLFQNLWSALKPPSYNLLSSPLSVVLHFAVCVGSCFAQGSLSFRLSRRSKSSGLLFGTSLALHAFEHYLGCSRSSQGQTWIHQLRQNPNATCHQEAYSAFLHAKRNMFT